MSSDDTVLLAQSLIRQSSVSPEDGDCQQIMASYLKGLGFEIEHMPFGPVKNLWATYKGDEPGPLFAFAGHTDVVPTGPVEAWNIPPFEGRVVGDILHGRGAADMKGSLAAMMTAASQFLSKSDSFAGSIGFLITSDEEDMAIDGTIKVIETLINRGEKPDYCLVGEPSSGKVLGDVVRVGRRGSLSGKLTVQGIQGHVAYPDDADNPIHRAGSIIEELNRTHWDNGNEYFPATTFQISNVHAGTGAGNVIPGHLTLEFNLRFSTESTEADLKTRFEAVVASHCTDFDVDWRLSGVPFLTTGGHLIPAVQHAIKSKMHIDTELSTSGGTSDGRFIAPHGIEVVELGPCNATIHKVDEQVSISSLGKLADVYEEILIQLLRPREAVS